MHVYLLFLLWSPVTLAFNFAMDFADIFSDPSKQSGSYFGYSVVIRKGADDVPKIIVGAPRVNFSHGPLHSLVEPGTVYWCTVLTHSCTEDVIDSQVVTKVGGMRGIRDNSYLGGSLDAQGNYTVMCAPNWKNNGTKEYYMNGMCYVTGDRNRINRVFALSVGNVQAIKTIPLYFANGESGFSVNILEETKELLIGAPGLSQWRGAIIRHHWETNLTDAPDKKHLENLNEYDYLGYSIGYGKFPGMNGTLYIAGAPRAADHKGKVMLLNFTVDDENKWMYDIHKEWVGMQMGEYFGAAVCITDINADGYDDVLVGAPQYSRQLHNMGLPVGDEGCLYTFITDAKNEWKEFAADCVIMGSSKQGARFGTAISALGDVNMDKYNDVAVGAPYEDEHSGAIYIYHGSENGLNPVYSQRIAAREIAPYLRGFGASISRGMDVDNNYYNDVAVGAYLSGHMVVLKTYPVVQIHANYIPSQEKIEIGDTQFNSSVCLFHSGEHIPSKIEIAVKLLADPYFNRATFLNGKKDHSYDAALELGKQYCKNFTIVIHDTRQLYRPIDITMEYKLKSTGVGNQSDIFCKSCPVLDPRQSGHLIWKMPYNLGCKQDTTCRIDLQVKAEFINVTTPFILGTHDSISLKIVLENKHDPAYMAQLLFSLPQSVPYRRLPSMCHENATDIPNSIQLICDAPNPMSTGTKHELTLELDVSNVVDTLTNLEININAVSGGEDFEESDNHVLLTMLLSRVSEFIMIGYSSHNEIIYTNKTDDDEVLITEDKNFTHTYEILNKGPSPLSSLKLEFSLPYKVRTARPMLPLLDVDKPMVQKNMLHCITNIRQNHNEDDATRRSRRHRSATSELKNYPENRTLVLDCSRNNVECMTIRCDLQRQLIAKSNIHVVFHMKANLKRFVPQLKKKNIIFIGTSGKAQMEGHKTIVKEVSTVLVGTLTAPGVDWWIIVIAVISGILILLLIIFGLHKFGFFKRKQTMELQAERHKSVETDPEEDAADSDLL